MNLVERALRKADQAQQRHTGPAFVVGVAKKFGDDNGGRLISGMTHAAFVSLFPPLPVLVTALGLVASAVLARRLWPRTVIQPPLTPADRTSLALQVLENQRREEQQVTVTFREPGGGTAPSPRRPPDPFRVPKPRRPSE
jgi:uncharacterized BrkB/YihY/UPF0761 family membrane protein